MGHTKSASMTPGCWKVILLPAHAVQMFFRTKYKLLPNIYYRDWDSYITNIHIYIIHITSFASYMHHFHSIMCIGIYHAKLLSLSSYEPGIPPDTAG